MIETLDWLKEFGPVGALAWVVYQFLTNSRIERSAATEWAAEMVDKVSELVSAERRESIAAQEALAQEIREVATQLHQNTVALVELRADARGKRQQTD